MLATLVVLAGTACSHTNPGTTHHDGEEPGTPIAAPAPVPADVQQQCTRFVTAALSVDAATDSGPGEARQRAADQFGIPGLAQQIGGEGRDNGWEQLAAHRAHVEVTTEPVGDDPPPVRGDETGAGVKASRVAIAEGWRQSLDPLVAYCSLRRDGGGWKITGLTLSDAPDAGAG
ncbi:hypothetical protein [Amycolatopsis anabasis]|uniref:hypothetical protein n=1 Tax=Amycolatopsis anabasis TaxID=1840409 RepID=UPI00131C2647|nr:hypothetical protein [Amycolatopsis anabasis]